MTTKVEKPPLLSVAETAQYLGVCEATVRRRIDAGDLPALRFGKSIRISPEALEERLAGPLFDDEPYPESNRFAMFRNGRLIWEGSVLEAAEIMGRTPEEIEERFNLGRERNFEGSLS